MLVSRSDPEDAQRFASRDELARALARLTATDLKRLELIARMRSNGLPAIEWQDLLQEGLARTLSGRRRWPKNIPLLAFLAQVMRSLASEIRDRPAEIELAEDALVAGADDGMAAIEAEDLLRAIERRFAEDEDVRTLLDGLLRGETAKEIQARLHLSPHAYDAARKRFWRGLAALKGEAS